MCINRQNLGVAVGFGSSSLINGSNETLECELLLLSHVCLIEDGALRFCYVAREEEASHLFDREPTFQILKWLFKSWPL